jgi:DNA-binding NarL/FixJ family response regulator
MPANLAPDPTSHAHLAPGDPMAQTNARPRPGQKLPKARRIFLVDDHPVIRRGVALLINDEPDLTVCGEADNGPLAVEMIPKASPDLAIVDLSLKTTSGIELLKDLKALMPALPVLVMSMHDESLYAERSLRAGARGYLMKNEPGDVVISAIRRVLSGELHLSDPVKGKLLGRLARSQNDAAAFSMDNLSDRELEVFRLIGTGLGTRQIAERLNLSVKTIDSHREHLKAKLQLETGASLVHRAIQWMKGEDPL